MTAPELDSLPLHNRTLWLSTLVFGWCFAIWTLYAFAGVNWQAQWQLSATELGILLASPMLSGALLRLPAGLLAQHFGAKQVWLFAILFQSPPLWFLAYAQSYSDYLLLGLWLGIAGVSFTLGSILAIVPVAESQRGIALGIFGTGNAGAIASLLLFSYAEHWSLTTIFQWLSGINVLVAAVFWWFLPEPPPLATFSQTMLSDAQSKPTRDQAEVTIAQVHGEQVSRQIWRESRLWRFALYYYFVFGCFLALMLWLPHYYMTAYQLPSDQAFAFTLFFVTTSSLVRSLGGWLSARVGSRTVNWSVLWLCLICLFFLSYPPSDLVISGIHQQVSLHVEIGLWLFTLLIFVIGIAQGLGRASVYSLLYHYYPQQFAVASGFVSAAGALGGFTLPILFGLAQDLAGIYSACFMLLYGVTAICMMLMFWANRREQFQRELARARADNFLLEDD